MGAKAAVHKPSETVLISDVSDTITSEAPLTQNSLFHASQTPERLKEGLCRVPGFLQARLASNIGFSLFFSSYLFFPSRAPAPVPSPRPLAHSFRYRQGTSGMQIAVPGLLLPRTDASLK